jgi:Flp pilus assembly pilin Flp
MAAPNWGVAMLSLFRRFARDAGGATAIEYGLIAFLIAIAAVFSLRFVGGRVANTMTLVSNALG